jgi:hypothetical protein
LGDFEHELLHVTDVPDNSMADAMLVPLAAYVFVAFFAFFGSQLGKTETVLVTAV